MHARILNFSITGISALERNVYRRLRQDCGWTREQANAYFCHRFTAQVLADEGLPVLIDYEYLDSFKGWGKIFSETSA